MRQRERERVCVCVSLKKVNGQERTEAISNKDQTMPCVRKSSAKACLRKKRLEQSEDIYGEQSYLHHK